MSNHESSPIKKAVATSLVLGASLLPSITHAEANIGQSQEATSQVSHMLVNSQESEIKPLITTIETSIPSSEKILDTSISRFFPETNHSVDGIFLEYWQSHGGLAQQGYPLSERLQEISETDGKTYAVQYFERAVFEDHPENDIDNEVLLQLLGALKYNEKYPQGAPHQTVNSSPDAVLFPETGHTIGGTFLKYWQSHGGLAQHGYPVSDEFQEIGEDGKNRTVQYFQRDEFEDHTGEYEDAANNIQLTRIGDEYLHKRYDKPSATATPTPPAEATATPEATEGTLTLDVTYAHGEAKFYVQDGGVQIKDNNKDHIIAALNDMYDIQQYQGTVNLELISLPAGTLDGSEVYNNGKSIRRSSITNHQYGTSVWFSTDPEEIMKNNEKTEKSYLAMAQGSQFIGDEHVDFGIGKDILARYGNIPDLVAFGDILRSHPELQNAVGYVNGVFDSSAVPFKMIPLTP